MRYAVIVLLLAPLFGGVGLGQSILPPDSSKEESIQALIDEALTNNPEIAVQLHNMEAANRRIPQAGALPDPELVFKLMEIPGTQFDKAMYANVELMQVVPFPTKLSARRSLAELLFEHSHHEHMEKALSIIFDLKSAIAQLRFERQSLNINRSNQDLLNRVLNLAQTSYAVGRTPQQEVIRIRVELAKVGIHETQIHEQIVIWESRLHALLGRSTSVPIGRIGPENNVGSIPTVNKLIAFASESRPMLIHDSLNVVEKGRMVDLMRQEYLPDLKFGLEYVRMPALMENRWSVTAGITLPFAPWTVGKSSARIQEVEAEKLMMASTFSASRNMVESQIRSEYASVQTASKEIFSYQETILPQLHQSIDLLLTDYATAKTSFPMVLDGYRMLNEAKLDLASARMNYELSIAALEREIGISDLASLPPVQKEKQ